VRVIWQNTTQMTHGFTSAFLSSFMWFKRLSIAQMIGLSEEVSALMHMYTACITCFNADRWLNYNHGHMATNATLDSWPP
jgi:hypothetical protein